MDKADYPRCKTCKWWNAAASRYAEYADCVHPLLNALSDEGPLDGLNGSGQEYQTATGPDFGCVHWEAKEESNG